MCDRAPSTPQAEHLAVTIQVNLRPHDYQSRKPRPVKIPAGDAKRKPLTPPLPSSEGCDLVRPLGQRPRGRLI